MDFLCEYEMNASHSLLKGVATTPCKISVLRNLNALYYLRYQGKSPLSPKGKWSHFPLSFWVLKMATQSVSKISVSCKPYMLNWVTSLNFNWSFWYRTDKIPKFVFLRIKKLFPKDKEGKEYERFIGKQKLLLRDRRGPKKLLTRSFSKNIL